MLVIFEFARDPRFGSGKRNTLGFARPCQTLCYRICGEEFDRRSGSESDDLRSGETAVLSQQRSNARHVHRTRDGLDYGRKQRLRLDNAADAFAEFGQNAFRI
jgi:hypothetical protein